MSALHVDRDQRGHSALSGAGALNRGEKEVVPLGKSIDLELPHALIPEVELLNEEGAVTRLMPSEDLRGPGRDVGTDENQVFGLSIIMELGSHILKEGRSQLCIQPGIALGCLEDLISNPVGETGLFESLDGLRQG